VLALACTDEGGGEEGLQVNLQATLARVIYYMLHLESHDVHDINMRFINACNAVKLFVLSCI